MSGFENGLLDKNYMGQGECSRTEQQNARGEPGIRF
jgi:hypothetical protein